MLTPKPYNTPPCPHPLPKPWLRRSFHPTPAPQIFGRKAHLVAGFSLAVSLLLVFVGWPVVGTLVTIDDDLPGGWSNPDGTEPLPFKTAAFWGQVSCGLAVSASGAAIDAGVRTWVAIQFWLSALALGLGGISMLAKSNRWVWLVGAVMVAGALAALRITGDG